MNRDALLATIIGFGIGLVLTGLLLFGPTIAKNFPAIRLPKISLPKFQTKPTPTEAPNTKTESFTIDSPLPEAIESDESILVSGSAPKGTLVVVEGPSQEFVVSPNGDGKYQATVTLVEGRNDIYVTAYTQGIAEQKTVTIFYTPEKF